MNKISLTYHIYRDGFRNMRVGKTLWKIILVKLFVILVILKFFIHDKTFDSEFQTFEEKSEFVSQNLIKGKSND